MKKHLTTLAGIGATVAPLLLYAPPSYAYLDMGTGSVILQVILGGLAGLAVAGKMFWARILDFLGIRKIETEEAEADSQD